MPPKVDLGNQNRYWRAILIRVDADADHLNTLLEAGWYLEPIGLEGLPYLILPIVPEDFASPRDTTVEDAPSGRHPNNLPLVLVLTRIGRRRKQRGVVMRPDERGYFDIAWLDRELKDEPKGRYGTAFLRMENGNRLAFVDWGEVP